MKKKLAQGGVSESLDGTFLKKGLPTKVGRFTILGIVTLEDVLEEMINIENLDEDDYARTILKKRQQKILSVNIY